MNRLTIILLIMLGCVADARGSSLIVNPSRLVSVIGIVDDSILLKAGELITLAEKSKEPIYIHLNSPGGMVSPGLIFMDAMALVRERGVQLVCVSTALAASMAFNVMIECDERYALPNTQLLFHPVRVGGQFAADELAYYLDEVLAIEEYMKPQLIEMMGIDEEAFEYHYQHETFWSARRLQLYTSRGWLTVVTNIEGIPAAQLHTIDQGFSPFNGVFGVPSTKWSPLYNY